MATSYIVVGIQLFYFRQMIIRALVLSSINFVSAEKQRVLILIFDERGFENMAKNKIIMYKCNELNLNIYSVKLTFNQLGILFICNNVLINFSFHR